MSNSDNITIPYSIEKGNRFLIRHLETDRVAYIYVIEDISPNKQWVHARSLSTGYNNPEYIPIEDFKMKIVDVII